MYRCSLKMFEVLWGCRPWSCVILFPDVSAKAAFGIPRGSLLLTLCQFNSRELLTYPNAVFGEMSGNDIPQDDGPQVRKYLWTHKSKAGQVNLKLYDGETLVAMEETFYIVG